MRIWREYKYICSFMLLIIIDIELLWNSNLIFIYFFSCERLIKKLHDLVFKVNLQFVLTRSVICIMVEKRKFIFTNVI